VAPVEKTRANLSTKMKHRQRVGSQVSTNKMRKWSKRVRTDNCSSSDGVFVAYFGATEFVADVRQDEGWLTIRIVIGMAVAAKKHVLWWIATR